MLGYVITGILALGMIYLALIYESTSFALLGMSAVAFGVLSFFVLLFVSRKVSVHLTIPVKIADKGQRFSLRAEVRNDSWLPLGKCRVVVAYGESHGQRRERIALTIRDLPRGTRAETRHLIILSSGEYEFSIRRVMVFDPFGIFYLSKRQKSIAKALVLPTMEEIPVKLGEGVKHFYGETMEYDDERPGQDASETFGVREFQEGDKLQRIHWKLSARMDDLMVKEDSLPKACAILLFMPDHFGDDDAILDYMASLSYSLTDAKCAHYVVYQSEGTGDITRLRVDDEESFYLAVTRWLTEASRTPKEGKLERYREKYRGEHFLHSIVATQDGKVSVDEAEALLPKNFKEELFLR